LPPHIRINPPVDVPTPPPGTVTPSLDGSCVVIRLDMLADIAAGRITPADIAALLEALTPAPGATT
jgi:hypothetical protein